MIVSSARACERRSRRSAFGLSLRPKIDSGNRLRRAMQSSLGWITYLDVRHGAYRGVGLARPPIPPPAELEKRWPHGKPHNCRIDENGHRKREAEDLDQYEIAKRKCGENGNHYRRRAADEAAGARQAF